MIVKSLLAAGLRVLLGIDVALGVVVYAAVTLACGRPFEAAALAVALAAVLAPDLDMVPFLLLRKRLGLRSHRRIGHHPLLTVPLGAAAAALAAVALRPDRPADRAYWAALAGAALLAHYLHDSAPPLGLHWLSPFSWRHFGLGRRGLAPISDAAVQAHFAAKAAARRGREGWAEQIVTRIPPPGRAEGLWLGAALLGLLAVLWRSMG